VGAFFAVAVVVYLLMPADEARIVVEPRQILPAFVFVMYMASIGERATRAMFYNCDLALLRYPFYRQKDAVLSNFTVRLRMITRLNLVIAAAIVAAVVATQFLFGWEWPLLGIASFALAILSLAMFFSVHYLFLYYVFQPYTADLGMRNPFFQAINVVVYMACFLSLQIDSPPSYFTLVVIALTVAYMAVALFLVHRYAPRTFRLK
jgi:signal transduction histidine kinase